MNDKNTIINQITKNNNDTCVELIHIDNNKNQNKYVINNLFFNISLVFIFIS